MSATVVDYESFIQSAAGEWVSGITELAGQLSTAYTTEAQRWAAVGNFYYNKFQALAQQAQSYANAAATAGDSSATEFWNKQAKVARGQACITVLR